MLQTLLRYAKMSKPEYLISQYPKCLIKIQNNLSYSIHIYFIALTLNVDSCLISVYFYLWTLWDKVDETSPRAQFSPLSYEGATSEQIPVGFSITFLWSSGSTEHLSHQADFIWHSTYALAYIIFPII